VGGGIESRYFLQWTRAESVGGGIESRYFLPDRDRIRRIERNPGDFLQWTETESGRLKLNRYKYPRGSIWVSLEIFNLQ